MVPLRTDTVSSHAASWPAPRPRLVLLEAVPQAAPRPVRRHAPRRLDTFLLGLALASVLLLCVGSAVFSIGRALAASYASSLTAAVPVKTVRVAPGDTLWKYAARYGDPNAYILDRVEAIARDNRLSSSAPLAPGQVLRIAVRNPGVLAKMQAQIQRAHARLASLPRG